MKIELEEVSPAIFEKMLEVVRPIHYHLLLFSGSLESYRLISAMLDLSLLDSSLGLFIVEGEGRKGRDKIMRLSDNFAQEAIEHFKAHKILL